MLNTAIARIEDFCNIENLGIECRPPQVNSIYDPPGLAGPFTVRAKILPVMGNGRQAKLGRPYSGQVHPRLETILPRSTGDERR